MKVNIECLICMDDALENKSLMRFFSSFYKSHSFENSSLVFTSKFVKLYNPTYFDILIVVSILLSQLPSPKIVSPLISNPKQLTTRYSILSYDSIYLLEFKTKKLFKLSQFNVVLKLLQKDQSLLKFESWLEDFFV